MISCYVIGERHTLESLCMHINDYPLTRLKGYALQRPESFDAVYSVRPNIVFVDVAFLHGSNSWLERIKKFSSIVLLSENTEMAFEAFEHGAFDYLIRPVTFNRFSKSIHKFDHLIQLAYSLDGSKKQQVSNSFFIKADSKGLKEFLIKCDQLVYIQAMQNYVILHMENDQRFSCHNAMKEMEDSLPANVFSRIHRSYIINDEKITSIEGNMVILRGDETNKLLIGNTYHKTFFEKKAEKMIRKKTEIQVFSYSRLAQVLITFTGLLLKIQTIAELNIPL